MTSSEKWIVFMMVRSIRFVITALSFGTSMKARMDVSTIISGHLEGKVQLIRIYIFQVFGFIESWQRLSTENRLIIST